MLYAIVALTLVAIARAALVGVDVFSLLTIAAAVLLGGRFAWDVYRDTQAALAMNKLQRQVLGRICPQCGYDFRANRTKCSECGWENPFPPEPLK